MANSSTPNQGANRKNRKRAVPPSEKNGRRKLVAPPPEPQGWLDQSTKHTVAAIACIVVAAALLIIVLWPTNAVVATFLATAMKRGLGVGALLVPVLLAVLGISMVVRIDSQPVPARSIVGLSLMMFGLLVLLALFTPGATDANGPTMEIFDVDSLVVRGGYLGAGPAYVFLMLVGLPVSVILFIGVIAAGLALLGVSLGSLLEKIRARRLRAEELDELENSVMPAAPYTPAAPEDRQARRRHVDRSAPTQAIGEEQADPSASTKRLSDEVEGKRKPARAQRGAATQPLTRKLGRGNRPASDEAEESSPRAKAKATEDAPSKPEDGSFALPSMSLLKVSKGKRKTKAFEAELEQTAGRLQRTMEDFGIMATVVDWVAGPTVTLFEVDLPPGVRVSRLTNLNDDIALALAAPGVRIFAPIPGTHFVGIEVPNATRENVLLGDILKEVSGGPLEVAIGKDVEGNPIIEDLAKMPHLLIGGTTGSGKSVGINAMIMSILMRATPEQVRFIMIDPKRVEFAPYDGIPHLYVPVVTEPKEAASALSWGVAEMELRLKTFQKAGVRNIASFNELVGSGELRKQMEIGAVSESGFPQPQYIDSKMPYIVIVIDELADLMMNVGKEVEFSISRIAQLARAAGIHLIVATQRPSANVVTGLIKANITTRIAYNVASGLDSRVILDTSGAESLIGLGDLLLSKPELGKPLRIQGCFTSDAEISAVVDAVKAQGEPDYHSEILKTNIISLGDSSPDGSGGSGSQDDPLVWEAAEIVVSTGMGSTSNIQRKLSVGYARAGRIMDMLEEKGVVGPPNGSKPREVLVDAMELETLKAFEAADED